MNKKTSLSCNPWESLMKSIEVHNFFYVSKESRIMKVRDWKKKKDAPVPEITLYLKTIRVNTPKSIEVKIDFTKNHFIET